VLISLILVHGPVRAEWLMIDNRYQSPGLQTVYVDPGSIRREGNLVTISALIDWTWMQGNRSPTRFYSTKLTKLIDCAEMRVRTLTATDYYGHMGTGEVIGGGGHTSESHWVPIEPGTPNHGFWEAACGKG
jgi:hypothetical protein